MKPPPENFIVTARIVGIAAIESTLSPCDSLSTRSATEVLTPLLVWSVRTVFVVLMKVVPWFGPPCPPLNLCRPGTTNLSVLELTTPDH